MLPKIIEQGYPKEMSRGGFACLHGIEHPLSYMIVYLAEVDNHIVHRVGVVARREIAED